MNTFTIGEEFLLNNQPIKIISGAIHYFRLSPEQWPISLRSLHALGANTVETYIPWNFHEPVEGQFDFKGIKNVFQFISLAQKEGLHVIIRPSPYICAEWEFGGLPAWLLKNKNMRLRTDDEAYLEKVDHYYAHLLPKLVPYQIDHGGPIIMMQVENEYGSYGMDKSYLRKLRSMMEKHNITVPLFTSDGGWAEALDAGTLPEDHLLATANFGGNSEKNINALKDWMKENEKKWPIMCMECWDGWFNRWGENIVLRDAEDFAQTAKEILSVGSINLYMFHGGTTFGFYNGSSVRDYLPRPQITSYDYDALLTEWGQPTEKYYAVQRVIKELFPDVRQTEPPQKQLKSLGSFSITKSVSLFSTSESLCSCQSDYPMTMEEIGSNYGYLLYSFSLKNYQKESRIRLVGASDRSQIFLNQSLLDVQYNENAGEEILLPIQDGKNLEIDILVENVGRASYGYSLDTPTQSKGIRTGVMHDIHFHKGFKHIPLTFSLEELSKIDFSKASNPSHPSFYYSQFSLDDIHDTYVDCSSYRKGIVIINGNNLGRYWSIGPTLALYCPKGFLKKGTNEVYIFETEGISIDTVSFVDHPIYKEVEAL